MYIELAAAHEEVGDEVNGLINGRRSGAAAEKTYGLLIHEQLGGIDLSYMSRWPRRVTRYCLLPQLTAR